MVNKKTREELGFRDLLNLHQGSFDDAEEMELSLSALLELFTREGRHGEGIPSYLIKWLDVQFSEDRQWEIIEVNFSTSTIVVHAPKSPQESEKSLSERRAAYHNMYTPIIGEMKTRELTQLRTHLTKSGDKKMREKLAKRRRESVQ